MASQDNLTRFPIHDAGDNCQSQPIAFIFIAVMFTAVVRLKDFFLLFSWDPTAIINHRQTDLLICFLQFNTNIAGRITLGIGDQVL